MTRDSIVFTGIIFLGSITSAYMLGVEQTEDRLSVQLKPSSGESILYTKPIPELIPTYKNLAPVTKCTGRNQKNLQQCISWQLKKEYWK